MKRDERLAAAVAALRAGNVAEAKRLCVALSEGAAPDADVLDLLATIAIQQRDFDGAIRAFGEVARLRPGDASAHARVASVLLARGRTRDALAAAERALALRPDFPEALLTAGSALLANGRAREGTAALERALALRPDVPEALNNLANGYIQLGEVARAEAALRRAVAVRPTYAEAHASLGIFLRAQERIPEAIEVFERAVALDPKQLVARWDVCMARLPIVYADEAEVAATRARYADDLRALTAVHERSSRAELARAARGVGIAQPFMLAYQGENDRPLQALYGALAARFLAAAHPDLVTSVPMPPRAPGEKLRVGIVSGYFARHSNWKIPIRGWIEQLDRGRFSLFGYHTRDTRDGVIEAARASLEKLELGPRSTTEWGAAIRADQLHVLIFPELGMDSATMRLACLRLAPVQCSSWGHPNTSGLPTVDYFLSSDLMEPPDGDAHYTESLVRLPNLGIYYEPTDRARVEVSRAELGIRDDAVLYFCCQSIFKYLPRYDDVFARIARDVPNAQFLFVDRGSGVNAVFRARLQRVFEAAGLRYENHCIFTPLLEGGRFDGAIRVSDVFLDSLGWSGCNSTLESIAFDLPVVTAPGLTMRSRHSAAILTMMGMGDCVATSVDDYVRRAIALGLDADARQAMRARVAENKHRILRDRAAIEGLASFLERVAAQPQPAQAEVPHTQ